MAMISGNLLADIHPPDAPTVKTLRPYQIKAARDTLTAVQAAENPLDVLPTAGGKTVVMAGFLRLYFAWKPDAHVLVLAHRSRLLTQAENQFAGIPTHIMCAGLGRMERGSGGDVTIASIQTLAGQGDYDWDLVIIDEAHRIPLDLSGQYGDFLKAIACPYVGFTATPWRLEHGRSVSIAGKGKPFSRIVAFVSVADLLRDSYLCPPKYPTIAFPIPVRGIKTRDGEYVTADLRRVARVNETERMRELVQLVRDRSHVVVFCVDREDAKRKAAQLHLLRQSTATIDGTMPDKIREGILSGFQSGRYRFLLNIDVLTEGLDVPEIDTVALMRPTLSVARYLQMGGRGLRTHDSKKDCLILDFSAQLPRFGPLEAARDPMSGRAYSKKELSEVQPSRVQPIIDPLLDDRAPERMINLLLLWHAGIAAPFSVAVKAFTVDRQQTRNSAVFLVWRVNIGLGPWAEWWVTLRDPVMQALWRDLHRINGITPPFMSKDVAQVASMLSGLPVSPAMVQVQVSMKGRMQVMGFIVEKREMIDLPEREVNALQSLSQQVTDPLQRQALMRVMDRVRVAVPSCVGCAHFNADQRWCHHWNNGINGDVDVHVVSCDVWVSR
jgi:superfamily II DNA or RNA helicase